MNRDACISESTAHMCTVCVLFIYMGSVIVPSLQLVDFTWIPWRVMTCAVVLLALSKIIIKYYYLDLGGASSGSGG